MTASTPTLNATANRSGAAIALLLFTATLAGGLLTLAGCQNTTPAKREVTDNIDRMLDMSRPDVERREAMDAATKQSGGTRRWVEANRGILWGAGYPGWQRRRAIDELIKHDQAELRQSLLNRLWHLDDWSAIAYLFDRASKLGWTELTPAIVHTYAQPRLTVPDNLRPEREALQRLNPGLSAEQVIYRVFVNDDNGAEFTQQAAAWELLNRLRPRDEAIRLLEDAPSKHSLVYTLQQAWRDLHVLVTNREGILWVMYLRTPEQFATWRTARDRLKQLTPKQRGVVQLRHVAMLNRLPATTMQLARDRWVQRIEAVLRDAEHVSADAKIDGLDEPYPQAFSHWEKKLSWLDLATIDAIASRLDDPQLRAALFKQADDDTADKQSEHGGVLDVKNGRLHAIAFEPMKRPGVAPGGDRDAAYSPTPDMIERMYTGLAHYHFHASKADQRYAAGPGPTDRALIDRLTAAGVVFTRVGKDKLNVDYYQPGGAVIDLGTLKR